MTRSSRSHPPGYRHIQRCTLPRPVDRQPLITDEKNSLFTNGYRLPWGQWYITKLHHQYLQDICIATPNFWLGSCGIEGKTDIQSLESYHRTTLRELQSLPKRTAKCAVYLLAGTLPLEGLIDLYPDCITAAYGRWSA